VFGDVDLYGKNSGEELSSDEDINGFKRKKVDDKPIKQLKRDEN